MKRRLLFRRAYDGYTGGHGKVWDYYRHAAAHPAWEPNIHFASGGDDEGNPWRHADAEGVVPDWRPTEYDALFLAGMDWQAWPQDRDHIPVLNLIQHVRHASPDQPLRAFLGRRAIRICVSRPVAEAIAATGLVRGPVHVIEAGLDLPAGLEGRTKSGLLISAIKHPILGAQLASCLRDRGMPVRLLDAPLPRQDYLEAVAAAEIAVFLPHPTEGFYLPALEAMALGCAVAVPDCIGNRAYLEPGHNALVPAEYSLDGLLACIDELRDPALRDRLRRCGQETAARFTLARERQAFHALLDDLPALWAAA